jgi:hypothetical protein
MLARIIGAIAVAAVLSLMMVYIYVALTGWHKDALGGVVMCLAGVLSLVLGIGVFEMMRDDTSYDE